MYSFVTFVISLLIFGSSAQGQAQSDPVTSGQNNRADNTLAKKWNASTQGPLLIVDPDDANRVKAFTSVGLSFNPYDSEPIPRSVRRVGGMSALVPQFTYSVNRNAKINPFLSLTKAELWQLFETSLSDSQINQLCGAQGISATSLNDEQKQMFDSLLPNPLRVRELKKGNPKLYGEAANEFIISNADRNNLRLRMSLSSFAYLPTAATITPAGSDVGVFVGFRTPSVNSEGGFSKYRVVDGASHANLFISQTANRLKPSDLLYESPALQKMLDIPPTVSMGQLLAAVSKQTGILIQADARLEKVKCEYIGTSSVCSDVLKALALSVGGTYRKLPGDKIGYLLCHDLQGEAAYKFPVWSWYLTNSAARRNYLNSRLPQLSDGRFASQLKIGTGEMFPVDDATKTKIFQQVRDGKRPTATLPTSQIPSDLQEILRQTVSNYQAYQASTPKNQSIPKPINDSIVNISLNAKIELEIPNVGVVEDPGAASQPLRNFLEPASNAPTSVNFDLSKQTIVDCYVLTARTSIKTLSEILLARPVEETPKPVLFDVSDLLFGQDALSDKTRDDTYKLFQSLSAHGAKIYLVSDLNGQSVTFDEKHPATETLPKATDKASSADADTLDRNALGMDSLSWQTWYTRNVLGANKPRVVDSRGSGIRWFTRRDTSSFVNRLRVLQEIEGVEAVVLFNVAPNGYRLSQPAVKTPRVNQIDDIVGADFGYTVEMRGEFIDKYHCDPIDLLPVSLSGSTLNPKIPFFPNDLVFATQWANFRANKKAEQLSQFVSEWRKNGVNKRIFVADTEYSDQAGLFGTPVLRDLPRQNAANIAGVSATSPQNAPSFFLLEDAMYRELTSSTSSMSPKAQATLQIMARYQATKPNTMFIAVRKPTADPNTTTIKPKKM